ncbi:MAG: succinate dehydrogenase assembly factor 2 [Coxiellaceae bacterium]|nr:succinate dehydrogenase assembly factor 2 [Coxiellaceae bacterium]
MQNQSGDRGRLRWKCRRGMLELDMVLLRFLDRHYDELNDLQKQQFDKLLEEQDPVLQSWFMQQVVPEDKEMAAMVDYIRSALRKG